MKTSRFGTPPERILDKSFTPAPSSVSAPCPSRNNWPSSTIIEAANPIGGCVDMTGIGLGLAEDLSEKYPGKLTGIHFAQTTHWIEGLDVKIPEAMAVNILGLFEAGRIRIPPDATLRVSLQLPERSGSARGMIYTPRTNTGHADDFWSLALAAWSARAYETPFTWHAFVPRTRIRSTTL